MSISIGWQLVKPSNITWVHGTSSDWAIFEETFGHSNLGVGHVCILRAMHRAATGNREGPSLWGDLADALEQLPEGSLIKVVAEY